MSELPPTSSGCDIIIVRKKNTFTQQQCPSEDALYYNNGLPLLILIVKMFLEEPSTREGGRYSKG